MGWKEVLGKTLNLREFTLKRLIRFNNYKHVVVITQIARMLDNEVDLL